MAVTASKALFERMRFYNEHGRATGGKAFEIAEVGFKYKMSNIQAALGLGQLERIDELVEKKRTILGWYRERLGNIPGLAFNAQNSWSRGIAWMSSVILDSERHPAREEVCRRMKAMGVDTRPFFPPLSSFPMFTTPAGSGPVAARLGACGINLPSGHNLTEADIDRVAMAFRAALKPARAAA
jgi:perosamine synthetase